MKRVKIITRVKRHSFIKNLFQNIGLAVILNLLVKATWVYANILVQDEIGHTDFGLYLALYSFGFLFLALSDMGINQYTTKTLASSPGDLREIFPKLLFLKIILSLAYPVFMLGAGWLLGYRGIELQFLFILCFVHGILQVNAFFRSAFQAFQKFRIDAFASILDRLIMLGIVVFLLLTDISIETYIYAYLISVVVAMVILYIFILKLFGFIKPVWHSTEMVTLIRKSFPFAVVTILYSINDKVDQVMLERLLPDGKEETGLYGGAYRWVDTVMMYLWTVLPIFFAKFAHHIRSGEAKTRLLAFGQPIAALPMIFCGIFVWFHGDILINIFKESTPEQLETMTLCVKILFTAVVVNGLFAIYSTLLTSTGHEKFVSWMIGISIVLNMGLNFIFIPQYGAVASAITTVISYTFLSVSYLVFIGTKLKVRLPLGQLGKVILTGAAVFGTFYAFTYTQMHWAVSTVAAGLVLLVLTYFFKLIQLKQDIE